MRRTHARLSITTLALAALAAGATALATPAAAQSLADRVARAPAGPVRFHFAARDGVCGNGNNISVRSSTDEWESDCEAGPVNVVLRRDGTRITAIKSYVGGHWRDGAPGTDLGEVEPQPAADYLLDLAARLPGNVGDDAVFPATIARGVTAWPKLLQLARSENIPVKTRRSAVFWVGQAAGDAATKGLEAMVGDSTDREVRESAVFALSQRPDGEGVPALIRVARTDRDPKIRRSALFWLGQSNDPRALGLFEELLTKR